MLYIDACSYDKMQMTIAAEMTEAQAKQMLDETIFQHAVSYGKSSLC
jgi:hypothetical protein